MNPAQSIKSVLVVEDDPQSARLSQLAIQETDPQITIHLARSGAEAWEVLQTLVHESPDALPDLVLLDITLPGVDGWQLLAQIRRDAALAHLHVVVLTVSKDDRYVQKCYDLHADGFVNKPLSSVKFTRLVTSRKEFSLSIEPPSPDEGPSEIWY